MSFRHDYDVEGELPDVPKSLAPEEPAYWYGGVVAITTALIAGAVVFGFDIPADVQVKILGGVAAIAPLILAALVRAKVWSPAMVRRVVENEKVKAVNDYKAKHGAAS